MTKFLSPLSVRYFSARSGSLPGHYHNQGLKLELPLAQSAFSPLPFATQGKRSNVRKAGKTRRFPITLRRYIGDVVPSVIGLRLCKVVFVDSIVFATATQQPRCACCDSSHRRMASSLAATPISHMGGLPCPCRVNTCRFYQSDHRLRHQALPAHFSVSATSTAGQP